jgi:hypothetical protein
MEAQGTTSALDGGEWSVLRPGRALPQGKGSTVHNGQDAGWAADPVCIQRFEEKSLASARDLTWIASRPVRSQTLYWLSYPDSW